MFVRYLILSLPIHKRSFEKYYRDHDRWVERQKPLLEKKWHRSFEEIPAHIRIHWKDRWYWPPWYYNDLVGYLRIGSGIDGTVAGDVFLKRRHFLLSAPERLYRDSEGPREREQFLLLGSTPPHEVTAGDNASYLAAVDRILEEARGFVREFGRGTRSARITLPGYGIGCLDLAEADRQLRRSGPVDPPPPDC